MSRSAAATEEIEHLLNAPAETFYRLPPTEIIPSRMIKAALENFRTHDMPAGQAATEWLRSHAFGEYMTSRTTLLLGRGEILGFYALSSASVEMDRDARSSAGVSVDRKLVPATLLAWIARNPNAQTTGREMCLHAIETCRRVNQLQATTVLILDAWDSETAEMWLGRKLGLRRLREGKNRLWLPLDGN